MPTYRELLRQVKAEIAEVDARAAQQNGAVFVDVREHDEWDEGHIPGAVHVPRGNLESRIEGLVPEHDREIVLYCSGGSRSAFGAKSLGDLGYSNVVSLVGGYTDWKRNGFELDLSQGLTREQR